MSFLFARENKKLVVGACISPLGHELLSFKNLVAIMWINKTNKCRYITRHAIYVGYIKQIKI